MEIRRITRENAGALRLKNDPFAMPGRFVPSLREGQWNYGVILYETPESMAFPDENYDLEKIDQNGCALAAYENGNCVGLIILEDRFWKYMHVFDLKVSASARGKGVGRALIRSAGDEARHRGYRGLYLEAQDTNLNACLFYRNVGFVIGGFDNHRYDGTSQADKADVIFYLDL